MTPLITINTHTTTSSPHPHILYTVQITLSGKHSTVDKRYSEFVALHETLKDSLSLPPKRLLSTTFIPSAWVDDALIKERKAGLAQYLIDLLQSPDYKDNPAVLDFLTPKGNKSPVKFNLEDAVPSTLSRKTALDLTARGDVEAEATMIAAAYYPDWSAGSFPPEKLDFSKFDILFFAFAIPNSSSGLTWDSGSQAILKRLVTSAHNSGKGTKIVLSVGGWGGSHYFSSATSSSANRTTFTNALKSAVNTFGLDGIDIDWEYPNSTGAGNPHSTADAANFLNLLKSLRTALGSSKIISAAVPHLPWLGSNGSPLKDASAYAAQLTYVNIMNYDVWGASASPGPNAPLGNLCGTSKQPQASAQAALSQWKAAGFHASKLLLGLPLYGYVSQSTKTGLTGSLLPSSNMVLLQQADVTTDNGEADMHFLNGAHVRTSKTSDTSEAQETQESGEATINATLTSWWGQQIPFSAIVKSGALVKKSDGTYGQGGGFTMAWDDCSDTPFLFNVAQKTVVTYDDTYSLADKAAFAKKNGMAGCFTWSLDQDDNLTLQNVIRKNLGK
ncbi:glycoside hydrolase family 18 protein [Collybia nuda]|uniref:Glycoside hydrolase family 18 protein n=1 Tax=Collybia nuda TaxID=64659 RepID=A0A9P5XYM6_9AGAR|nr:glycoside hydrolase family 18 protein [Collybia nuda]